jgi:NADH-quinone oxidoreductase subunit J
MLKIGKLMFENLYTSIHVLLFYILAIFSLSFSIITVCAGRTLKTAIFLCATMVVNACFYLLLGSEFLAIVQLLVYVSGIIVLLIFVIMLTDIQQSESTSVSFSKKLFSLLLTSLLFVFNTAGILCLISKNTGFYVDLITYNERQLSTLGFKILDLNQNGYILPFELISILLLVVLIGCLKISRK